MNSISPGWPFGVDAAPTGRPGYHPAVLLFPASGARFARHTARGASRRAPRTTSIRSLPTSNVKSMSSCGAQIGHPHQATWAQVASVIPGRSDDGSLSGRTPDKASAVDTVRRLCEIQSSGVYDRRILIRRPLAESTRIPRTKSLAIPANEVGPGGAYWRCRVS